MSDVARIPPLAVIDGKPVVTSLQIAAAFDKQHKNVLRDIEEVLTQVPDSFGKLNFGLSGYTVPNNLGFAVPMPMYRLARDGFALLVMGYTGRKAMAVKVAYIEEFNRLEALARSQHADLTRLQTQLAACHAELLQVKPVWGKIARYKRLGLNHVEIGLLTVRHLRNVRRNVRRIEACGLLPTAPQMALTLEG